MRVDPNSPIGTDVSIFNLVTAVSQTGLVIYSYVPGYIFQLMFVRTFCSAVATTMSGQILVNGNVAATLSWTANTEVTPVLSTTVANVRTTAKTQALSINYTSGGGGSLTNGSITFGIRPYPMHGEAGIQGP